MEEKFFDFEKEKVQTLTLEQLERTHKENDVYGNPLRGIYHYQLINELVEICNKQHYDVEIYDLFAAQNRDRNTPGVVILPQVEAQYGERAVEAHILRRVFANIRLTNWDDESYTTNLAVAFHQKGIQVGFGNMVRICHNQCLLGADHYIATYNERGAGRLPQQITVEEVMQTVKSWLFDAEHRIVTERAKLERMKEIEVGAEQAFTIIGMLTAIRVKCDSRNSALRENKTYPLNQSQISEFTEGLLLKFNEKRVLTAYDIYDIATNLYKANSMDIPALLPQNRSMVKFIDEFFNL